MTEGKEERRPSPVASISRGVSSVPFSFDLADVNYRTRILTNFRKYRYRENPVNFPGITCNKGLKYDVSRVYFRALCGSTTILFL